MNLFINNLVNNNYSLFFMLLVFVITTKKISIKELIISGSAVIIATLITYLLYTNFLFDIHIYIIYAILASITIGLHSLLNYIFKINDDENEFIIADNITLVFLALFVFSIFNTSATSLSEALIILSANLVTFGIVYYIISLFHDSVKISPAPRSFKGFPINLITLALIILILSKFVN